ncbi:cd81 antigen-like protein [Dermatophagoides farinae]|uniref:Tetraspanin n=2 Tax=Dermatophagoides farinae TaxID=6954 RepID=A0A9D4P6Y7_DERFA|nr:tetraspanin-18-like [Dermatophagoides farinae]XP_046912570.1 tetraspanin-18-like [Dermatophagoides farinae]XP_046912571.1 tetraspanin-18-like [Dermatophagoides farinae]KAH7644165.1 cd81 antigen-like protein [Dermatophagoides farinae]
MFICIKLIVVLYNFIFWLTGVFILSLFAYLYWDSQNYLDIQEISTHYVTPFIALLILGALMTIIGFLGCCGAIRESKCLLLMYISICLILCVLSGAFLFWTIRNGEKVRERIRLDTTKLIKRNYGTGNTNATEMLVDRIQRYFSCCGIMGPEDWITSNYNNQTNEENSNLMNNLPFPMGPDQRIYRIPRSCCQDYEESCPIRLENIRGRDIQNLKDIRGLNNDGCMSKFEEFIRQKQLFIILAGTILVGVQVLALIFSFCLFCVISRQDDK